MLLVRFEIVYKGPASSWLRPVPLRPEPVLPVMWASQPIRAQLTGHVICLDQSEASDAGSVGLTTGPRTPAPAEAETRVWTPERSEDSGCEHRQCSEESGGQLLPRQARPHDGRHDHREEGLHFTVEKSHHQGMDLFSRWLRSFLLFNNNGYA